MRSKISGALFFSAVFAFLAVSCSGGRKITPAEDVRAAARAQEKKESTDMDVAREEAAKELAPPSGPYRIKAGDLIEIDIIGEEDARREVRVGPDGRISYNIASEIVAAGLTFRELREIITESLREYYISPEIIVTGLEYSGNTVSVLGQVRKPGRYEISDQTTLLDVIAMSGGIAVNSWGGSTETQEPTEMADLEKAFLMRKGKFLPVDFAGLFSDDNEKVAMNNIRVVANDRIYIPAAVSLDNKVFVLGQVRYPQVVRYRKRISFIEAIAESGGPALGSWDRMGYIVRGSLSEPEVIPMNLREVQGGYTADLELAPGDIVFLPRTPLRTFANIVDQLLPGLQAAESAERLSK